MTLEAPATASIPDNVARLRAALGPTRDIARPLLPSLAALDWVMTLPNTAAPGFVYFAGACQGIAVGGGGRDLDEAAARLAGETAETLAQLAAPALSDGPADAAIEAIWSDVAIPARVAALNLTRGRPVAVPAAAIHLEPGLAAERRSDGPPRSLGLGAGLDRAAARLAGLLELIERDAAAAWWMEGVAPRGLDVGLTAAAAADLARMRAGAVPPGRPTSFLDLASPTGLPVICALSRDADGGGGLAFGLKAALCPRAAARGAMLELLQMEMALELARHRLAQGRAAAGDHGPLARAALDPDAIAAFTARPPAPNGSPSIAGLDDLTAHLAGMGHEVTVADLEGPPAGLKVAKVFVPGLRPMPGGGLAARPGAPGAQADLM